MEVGNIRFPHHLYLMNVGVVKLWGPLMRVSSDRFPACMAKQLRTDGDSHRCCWAVSLC